MRLEYMLLADKAEAVNGKLYLLGGGLDTVRLITVPALASYDIVVSVKFPRAEAGSHQFDLALHDEAGTLVLGPLGGQLVSSEPVEGTEGRVMLVVNGPFPVTAVGHYRWSLKVDGETLAEAPVAYQDAGLTRDELASIQTLSFANPTADEPKVPAEKANEPKRSKQT